MTSENIGSIFCLLSLSSAILGQDVRLDKLSDCDALLQIQNHLQGPISQSCNPPQTAIEQKLMSRVQITPRLNGCLLKTAPTSRLVGFSCIDLDFGNARELVCYKAIAAAAIAKYQQNYDPALTFRYKTAAASCPTTNHDASEAPNSLLPATLSPVAKADFGFAVGLGDSRMPLAQAYHGFATLDPTIPSSNSAIEVFDMLQYPPGTKPQELSDAVELLGDWKYEFSDLPRTSQRDFARPFEQAYGEKIGVRIRLITISTLNSDDATPESRERDLEQWQREVGSYLKNKRFRDLTRAEFANTPFRDSEAIRSFIVKSMPFGNNSFTERFGPHLVLLVNEDDDNCNKVAEVLVAEPEDGVKNDHGSIGLTAFTLGSCSRDGGPDRVLDKLILEETKILEAR